MRRLRSRIALLTCLTLLLCGCSANQNKESEQPPVHTEPVVSEQELPQEPQELTLYTKTAGITLNKLVKQFNALDTGYTVKLVENLQTGSDIMKEIKAGNGSDLYNPASTYGLEFLPDYFMPLEQLKGIAACGEEITCCRGEDGHVYGLNVCCIPDVLAVAGSRYNLHADSTVSELMTAVRNSDADIFCQGMAGISIVERLAEFEKEDGFIDWENKTAHFDTEEFYDILSFAKSYEDNGRYGNEKEKSLLQDGKVFCTHGMCMSPDEMYYYDALLGENAVFLGCYGKDGKGFRSGTSLFLGNANSPHSEGIRIFLEYLLSQEGQQAWNDKSIICGMPLLPEVQEEMIAYYQEDRIYSIFEGKGIMYYPEKLDTFHESQLRFLLSHSVKPDRPAERIYSGYASVLLPYFEGQLTEAEAAKALNRFVESTLN